MDSYKKEKRVLLRGNIISPFNLYEPILEKYYHKYAKKLKNNQDLASVANIKKFNSKIIKIVDSVTPLENWY